MAFPPPGGWLPPQVELVRAQCGLICGWVALSEPWVLIVCTIVNTSCVYVFELTEFSCSSLELAGVFSCPLPHLFLHRWGS